ncbi:DNA methyltransferase [Pseudalkalibacillus hwajinpoensis]|uniref:site-specific DNA-methyltransferase (adenine-specific) n=1 Tax=Guptibacillus hwajinpoensis TaxID=208199 RepID=A0A4U1MB22_9BACL|nr:N-6 DNA methylase [Pseudalkalibacillus hwajinpoensis]TKD67691.1 DNA methyltransferase [Pseudalkalibacillus hwajinpoensis]
MAKKINQKQNEPVEQILFSSANKLRKNMDAAEYKHIALGLIFLKYISDSFTELYNKLKEGQGEYEGADPEDMNEYRAENVFYVPPQARWEYLQGRAKLSSIGKDVDEAMEAIEKDNPSLKGVLPKEYAKEKLDKQSLGGLIDLIGTIALGDSISKTKDVLGSVYEYFLGQFALAEGKKGGQFYTPSNLVRLLVEMLEPYEGRVFDPCCGSGGMFVQSEKFILAHSDRYYKFNDKKVPFNPTDLISIHGQESNQTTWRLCKMNLAIRGIDSSNVKWNNEGSFVKDAHPDLKADFIITNPPFNDKDWSGELLSNDSRWIYGKPPTSNANYAWIQHFIQHLSPRGKAGFLLATKSLASQLNAEKNIRKGMVEDGLVECIVLLPGKLFYSTPAPVSLWILSKDKSERNNETLFIDASRIYTDTSRTHRKLTSENINEISNTFKNWLRNTDEYQDIPGYCKSVNTETIRDNDYSLYPGHYIGVSEEDTDRKDKVESINMAHSGIQEIQNKVSQIEDASREFKLMVTNELSKVDKNNTIKLTLNDILVESSSVLGEREEPEILTCTENAGLVLQRERFSKRVATEDTSKYKIVKKSDIVYNPYLLWAGAIDQCWIVDEGITSPAYSVFNIKPEFEPMTIGHILKSSYMKKWYWNISIGTHERRRTAPPNDFLKLEVEIPDFHVQKRISSIYDEMMIQITLLKELQDSIRGTSVKLNEYFTGR